MSSATCSVATTWHLEIRRLLELSLRILATGHLSAHMSSGKDKQPLLQHYVSCLLYTSDAADE